jgi:hypothetical protein
MVRCCCSKRMMVATFPFRRCRLPTSVSVRSSATTTRSRRYGSRRTGDGSLTVRRNRSESGLGAVVSAGPRQVPRLHWGRRLALLVPDTRRELFHVAPNHTLTVVPFRIENREFTFGSPTTLFRVPVPSPTLPIDVAKDGRFLAIMQSAADKGEVARLVVLANWRLRR